MSRNSKGSKKASKDNSGKELINAIAHKKNRNEQKSVSKGGSAPSEVKSHESGRMSINRTKALKAAGWVLLLILSFTFVDLMVQYLNNSYSVAIVNGVRVSKSDFKERLEESYGKTVTQNLINEQLILQEASRNKVNVDTEEIDKIVDQTVAEFGGEEEYVKALEANNLTEERFRRDLRIRLLAQKMVVAEPSDEELQAFFEQYKASYFTETDTFESVKDKVKEYYVSQKFNELSAQWIQDLQTQAVIQNNLTDEPKYGILKVTRNILNNLIEDIKG